MTALASLGHAPPENKSYPIGETSEVGSPLRAARRLFHRATTLLFEASPRLTSEADRRQARLMASLSFANIVVGIVGAAYAGLLLDRGVPRALPVILSLHGGLSAVAYGISRTRHLPATQYMTLVVQWFIPMAAMIAGAGALPIRTFGASAWMSSMFIVAVGIASLRTTVLAVMAGLLVPIVSAVMGYGGATGDVEHAFGLASTTGILTILLNRHRHNLEKDRSAELRARNVELSAMGERLEAKSAELARSNEALEGAYKHLWRNQESLLLSEKMASLGRLTAGIAHEMNSPLAAVRGALAEAKSLTDEYDRSIGDRDVTEEDHHAIAQDLLRTLELAEKAAERAASFVRNIKSRTRDVGAHEAAPFDAVATVNDALHMLVHEVSRSKSKVHFEPGAEQIRIVGAAGKLHQVVINLVTNALDANTLKGGGDVRVSLVRDAADVVLTVDDQGPGIPPENIARIFEPLFTTKPVGQGTGLGLTIVHDIVRGDFRGEIRATNLAGGGARFIVRFPARDKA